MAKTDAIVVDVRFDLRALILGTEAKRQTQFPWRDERVPNSRVLFLVTAPAATRIIDRMPRIFPAFARSSTDRS